MIRFGVEARLDLDLHSHRDLFFLETQQAVVLLDCDRDGRWRIMTRVRRSQLIGGEQSAASTAGSLNQRDCPLVVEEVEKLVPGVEGLLHTWLGARFVLRFPCRRIWGGVSACA